MPRRATATTHVKPPRDPRPSDMPARLEPHLAAATVRFGAFQNKPQRQPCASPHFPLPFSATYRLHPRQSDYPTQVWPRRSDKPTLRSSRHARATCPLSPCTSSRQGDMLRQIKPSHSDEPTRSQPQRHAVSIRTLADRPEATCRGKPNHVTATSLPRPLRPHATCLPSAYRTLPAPSDWPAHAPARAQPQRQADPSHSAS